MRVCYFGTYREDYARNEIMIAGLERAGLEVVRCHTRLWTSFSDRVEVASGGWMRPAFWLRLLRAYSRLVSLHRRVPDYDVMVVGYPGPLDVFLARWLTHRRGKPLVWDVFMSVYLIAYERGLGSRSPLSLRLLRGVERRASRLPDLLVIDTAEYAEWFASTYRTAPESIRLVPTGADDRVFTRGPAPQATDGTFCVAYHGSFLPSHGLPYIVEAARLLQDEPGLHFVLIGDGPARPLAEEFVRRYRLTNITLPGWMHRAQLVPALEKADLCLGAFGQTTQSLITIHNKVYEAMALGKPVITGDSPAVRRVFRHGGDIYLCDRSHPASLASGIRELREDAALRARIAVSGHRLFEEQFTVESIGRQFARHLREVTS